MDPYQVNSKDKPDSFPEPLPFGGWLILVGIGVVVSPIRIVAYLFNGYMPIILDGTLAEVTTPDSDYYIPYFDVYLASEFLVNMLFILASLYLVYTFFKKYSHFPQWYGLLSFASVIFLLVDAYFASLLIDGVDMFDRETISELFRVLVSLLIWTPYLLISSRSKETFVIEK